MIPDNRLRCKYCNPVNIDAISVEQSKEKIVRKEYLIIYKQRTEYEYVGKYRCNECKEISFYPVLIDNAN